MFFVPTIFKKLHHKNTWSLKEKKEKETDRVKKKKKKLLVESAIPITFISYSQNSHRLPDYGF